MDKVVCGQAAPMPRKGKKKPAKDELDRQKQAEKKRRRLEKALATSAAIRSELEKKKQKKKEEQQRLDEEGAAMAEAVALHVLVGEDAEESRCGDIGLFMGYQDFAKYSGCKWNDWETGQSPFYDETCQAAGLSAGLMAAQAVASLQIAEDPGTGAATFVINRMLGGDAVNFYKEL